jgi:tetratricopeptide (TPR) repeat protein
LPKLSRPLVVATASTLQASHDLKTDLAVTEEILHRVISWSEPAGRGIPDEIPLPDLDPADQALSSDLLPEAWDEWVIIERERLHQMRLHALESLACCHRSAGHFGQALNAALRAVAGEPLRESAHRQVIETYLAEGNTSEAIRHFKELRNLLRAELGLEPSSSLRHLMASTVGPKRAGRDG